MAVHTYGTTNISFSSFDTWANNISSDSNVTMNNALADASPANSNPTSASEIYNNNWFYGQVQVSSGGFVDVAAGDYTLNDVNSTTTLKNVNLDLNDLTLTADETAAYPKTFVRWRAGGASGTEIQTGEVLTLNASTQTSTTIFYAEFT
tara:strand:+ start:1398 stop:1844 length:447 start_codon:yes stop_codon:yes gene_type:complete